MTNQCKKCGLSPDEHDDPAEFVARELPPSKECDGESYLGYKRQYGRDDVSYGTWFSDWSKRLAREHTRTELLRMLGVGRANTKTAARSHHAAIAATASMQSQSQRRAQTRNCVDASAEQVLAIKSALEIHDLFPENAKVTP